MLAQLHYMFNRRFLKNKFVFSYIKIKNIVNFIYNCCFNYFSSILIKSNHFFLILKNNNIENLFFFLRNNFSLNYSQLMDLIIVDKLEMKLVKGKRFSFVYVLLSLLTNFRIYISGFLGLFEVLPSLTNIFSSADWLEREIWDMFGIFFVGHSNLRRILTDYGFVGFPLRKDFPLSGYVELRYDEISKSIVLEPLELTQEYRFFKLDNSWSKNVS